MQVVLVNLYIYACYDKDITIYITYVRVRLQHQTRFHIPTVGVVLHTTTLYYHYYYLSSLLLLSSRSATLLFIIVWPIPAAYKYKELSITESNVGCCLIVVLLTPHHHCPPHSSLLSSSFLLIVVLLLIPHSCHPHSRFQQIIYCWVGWGTTSTPSIMSSTPPPGPPPAG